MILPKHKKLVASGCSFTEGEGLDNPSTHSWPAVLANKLGLACVNLGLRGAGNDYISNSVLEYAIKNDPNECFFILAYSDHLRMDFYNTIDKNVFHLTPSTKKYPHLRDIFYGEFADSDYLFRKFILNVIRMQSWFEINDISYVMVNGITKTESIQTNQRNKMLYSQIDFTKLKNFKSQSFYSMIKNDGRLPDGHPNELGHQRIADTLYRWILEEK